MGKVEDVRLVFEEKDPIGLKRAHRGYGFVTFSSRDDTEKAVRTVLKKKNPLYYLIFLK